MDDQIFCDGIGAISVVGTTVRVDFVVLSPTERDANGQPKPVFKQRVIMSLDGFLRSFGKMQETIQGLTKMGALQATSQGQVAAPAGPRPDGGASEPASGPGSALPAQRTGPTKPPFP